LFWCLAAPVILGFGASWAATALKATDRRSFLLAWPLVLAAILAPPTMTFTRWPLRLAFLTFRPALERLTDRVAAGQSLHEPEWAGVYLVEGAAIVRGTGNVGLITAWCPGGRSGFGRLGTGTPSDRRTGPFHNLFAEEHMGGRWWLQDEN
jgi:hypothetical protein